VRAAPPERGWQAGSAEIAPDELRGDDTRYFAVWLGNPPNVRLDPSVGSFAQTAVSALVASTRVALGTEIDFASADMAQRLPALLVAPSDPVRIGAANRALERLAVPWRFGARRVGESAARGDRMDGVTVSQRYVLESSGSEPSDTVATVGGEPWIVAGEGYLLIASPLVPTATTLPISANFVPWLGDVLAQELGGDAGRVLALAPGAEFRAPQGTTGLETAAGEALPLDAAAPRAPMRQGVYFLRRGPTRVGAITVNVEPEESDLRRMDNAAFLARVRGRDVAVLREGEQWRAAAFAVGNRRPLGTLFLILLLLVVAAETLVARSGLRRIRRT
jgi:hypothetical protein